MHSPKITIIGLGYVGLPWAVRFSKKYATIRLDINICISAVSIIDTYIPIIHRSDNEVLSVAAYD